MLTLVATPLGNLGDLSPRAKEVLTASEVVLCEDTRQTTQLFHLLNLPLVPMISLHKFNEKSREDEVMAWLHSGKRVALVSDAGLPAISDPGSSLVARCHKEGVAVSIVPGPCAFASAFAVAGCPELPMQFVGFIPKKGREGFLQKIFAYSGATVAYESPNRVLETVEAACALCAEWELVLVRELTKLHEEVVRATARDLNDRLTEREVKGECTLVFLPPPRRERPADKVLVEQVAALRQQFSCSLKEAVELVAGNYGLPQRELYQLCIGS